MANYSINIMINNLKLMLDGLQLKEEEYEPLREFSQLNKFDRNFKLLWPRAIKKLHISRSILGFKVKRDGKTYFFKSFTNKRMSKYDTKRIRTNSLDITQLIWKVLEIVGSHELASPLFIFGTTNDEYKFLVEFSKNKKRYIIDIEYDIIMESNDYRELKKLKEIRTLDINQVYMMDYVMESMDGKIPALFFIMFYDEVMPYFLNLIGYKLDGIDEGGINYRNAHMFYPGCDTIFKAVNNSETLVNFYEVNDITEHPEYYNCFSEFDGSYLFKKYPISLYSNNIKDEDMKKDLLSAKRFNRCHYDNPMNALILRAYFKRENLNRKINIVSGRCYYGTKRYTYYTWVEFEFLIPGKFYVIDFTQNLVMERSKFYEYAGIEILESIDIEDYLRMEALFKAYGIKMMYRLKDIFATELLRDLEKNKSLIRN